MAPPEGAKPYHGFKVLSDVEAKGFVFGAITDFLDHPNLETVDAFIEAPDGTRCGVEWRRSDETYVLMMAPPNEKRWGVWMIGFTEPMNSKEAAARNLAAVRPELEERWRAWHVARVAGQYDTVT